LGSHHHLVIEALITIAKNRGVKFATAVPTVSCDSHLLLETSSDEGPSPQIMPMFCNIICDTIPSLQNYYLEQLTFLVCAIHQHIRACVNDAF
jgi:hypothetical protein